MNFNEMADKYETIFQSKPTFYLDAGGRLEIVGNHTDHNHGKCLVANCSLRIKAMLSLDTNRVKVFSEGYPYFEFDISDLSYSCDKSKTEEVCKGVLFKLKSGGYKIGGFTAFISSDIPNGSGVSSSAAIETLFGSIINELYNSNSIPKIEIAKAGQWSENNYMKKPCGLLDQIGTTFDECNYIDFKNFANPKIESISFDLPLDIYLVKSQGDHANLTPLYKAIPDGMFEVAKALDGSEFLADVKVDRDILQAIDNLKLPLDVKKKAVHFFIENENVENAKKAIKAKDVEAFLSAIRSSCKSSKENLKNTMVADEYKDSPQEIIDDLSNFLKNDGAARIHGGGFKGTVIAFVKKERADKFAEFLYKKYKSNAIFKVDIPKDAIVFKSI
jgi:galactokinase